MLAGTLEPGDLERVLTDDTWWCQQKLDGDRVLFQVEDGKATALNRSGEIRINLVPRDVTRQFNGMPGSWVFDGELLSDGSYWLFDLPLAHVHIRPSDPYRFRLVVLERFFAGWQPDPCIRLLPTARSAEGKRTLLATVMDQGGEGVIFKSTEAPYRPGRRSQMMLKAKFTKTADCVVIDVGRDGRANCHVGLFDDGQLVEVGSIGTAGRTPVKVGDVVEVRYLYASEDRRLYQPVLMAVRTDKGPGECAIDQLVFTNREVVALPSPALGLVRQRRRSRSAGVVVEVHDAWHPQAFVSPTPGRWVTLCVDHGSTAGHRTLRDARGAAARPQRWCEVCGGDDHRV